LSRGIFFKSNLSQRFLHYSLLTQENSINSYLQNNFFNLHLSLAHFTLFM